MVENKDGFIYWFSAYGLDCVIRYVVDHYCGYVEVPPEHPYFSKPRSQMHGLSVHGLSVHGGVTYAEDGTDIELPESWYVGFDCAHDGDFIEGMAEYGHRWTFEEVKSECAQLADQLSIIAYLEKETNNE